MTVVINPAAPSSSGSSTPTYVPPAGSFTLADFTQVTAGEEILFDAGAELIQGQYSTLIRITP